MMPINARRSLLVLIALVALGTGFAFSPAQAAPSEAELAAAALTAREVGTGFTVAQKSSIEQFTERGIPNYLVLYQKPSLRGFDAVMIVLADLTNAPDDSSADPSQVAGQLSELGIELTPTTAPDIGSDAKMYTISGSVFGIAMIGEAVTWRHGNIAAMVAAFGSGNPTAQGYAEQQEQKLGSLGN